MAVTDRQRNTAAWVISALLCVVFLLAGSSKFTDLDKAAEIFEHFGYAKWFAGFIATCEVAGAIGVLVPGLASAAGAGLSIVMAGAVASHLIAGDPASHWLPPFVLLDLAAVLVWMRWGVRFGGSRVEPSA